LSLGGLKPPQANAWLRPWTLGLCWYAAYRLDDFVIGLTNDDPAITAPVFKTSYTVCAQYSGSVAPGGNATVICPTTYEQFRFVIVHGSFAFSLALCLTKVFVYAKSTHQSYSYSLNRHILRHFAHWLSRSYLKTLP